MGLPTKVGSKVDVDQLVKHGQRASMGLPTKVGSKGLLPGAVETLATSFNGAADQSRQ